MNFTGETEFDGKIDEFLSVSSNKQQLIALIGEQLKKVSCTIIQALGDADVDIAKTAVDSTLLHSTTLIGEDTDFLMLLLHFCIPDGKPLCFRSDNQSRGNVKVDNINRILHLLGNKSCTQLLYLHVFTSIRFHIQHLVCMALEKNQSLRNSWKMIKSSSCVHFERHEPR